MRRVALLAVADASTHSPSTNTSLQKGHCIHMIPHTDCQLERLSVSTSRCIHTLTLNPSFLSLVASPSGGTDS